MVDVATGGAGGEDMPIVLRVPHLWGTPGDSVLGFGDVVRESSPSPPRPVDCTVQRS